MPRTIFPNIPVKDVQKTRAFWTELGFAFDERFCDENAVCMIVNDHASVMLLDEEFFKTFVNKDLTDTASHTEVILAISLESREEVDDLTDRALAAGAQSAKEPQDHGWMYQRSLEDLDGHLWELFHMDEAAFEEMTRSAQ